MKKAFINCDVTAVLHEIVGRHVKHYQSDFEVDKEIFAKAVQSSDPGNKYLLWLARPHGTHCLCERDVYVSDTYAHNAWLFCHEQTSDPVVAYAVELDGIMDGVIKGNLYELDYSASCGHVNGNHCLRPPLSSRIRMARKRALNTAPIGGIFSKIAAWPTLISRPKIRRRGKIR